MARAKAALPVGAPPAVPVGRDSWHELSRFTTARIALGRSGGSQRTDALLNFRLSHAGARDAVLRRFNPEATENALRKTGFDCLRIASQATSRGEYLMRPDLGRTLSPDSRTALSATAAAGHRDLAIIVSDGLSALATERHAEATLRTLIPLLTSAGWTTFPILVIPFGRVKIQDEIGELLGARHSLMLLGERPGLGSPDSLGAYFTFRPRPGCTDADRNCVSNIRTGGFPPEAAARTIARLMVESLRLGLSGVSLKDPESAPRSGNAIA